MSAEKFKVEEITVSKGEAYKYNLKTALYPQKELTFGEWLKATGLNRATFNRYIHILENEGNVTKSIGSRGKWKLTKAGQDQITKDGLVNQIQSCTVLGVRTENSSTTQTHLFWEVIKSDEKANAPKKYPNSTNPYKGNNFTMATLDIDASFQSRLGAHCLALTEEDIKKIAMVEEITVSKGEDLKEKVLEALSKRVKKVIFVEVFDPVFLLDEMRRAKEKDPVVCQGCGSKNLIEDGDAGEKVCGNCGLIIEKQ
jgi:hypothetical protein